MEACLNTKRFWWALVLFEAFYLSFGFQMCPPKKKKADLSSQRRGVLTTVAFQVWWALWRPYVGALVVASRCCAFRYASCCSFCSVEDLCFVCFDVLTAGDCWFIFPCLSRVCCYCVVIVVSFGKTCCLVLVRFLEFTLF